MQCKYGSPELIELVDKQINNYWHYGFKSFMLCNGDIMERTLSRLERCLSSLKSKYINRGGETCFNVEHSVSYAIFLYILSNELYKSNSDAADETGGGGADYVYYLNKIMHSVDWFYAAELPEHFGAEHPLGSVLGRARYGDFFFIYQGCTVGGNRKNGVLHYPSFGHHCVLYANSSVIGKCKIGNNVILSSNCHVKDEDIPDNSIVFGQSPSLVIKERAESDIRKICKGIWRM